MAKLILLIGPSGVGKDTIKDKLLRTYDLVIPRGCWTRPYRPYETRETADSDSISYQEFLTYKMRDELTADNIVHGEFYGTLKRNITEPLDRGQDVLRIVTADGATKIKHDLPGYHIVTLFLKAPISTLRKRLTARGDTPEQIERRLKTAKYELSLDEDLFFDVVIDADRSIPEVYENVVLCLDLWEIGPRPRVLSVNEAWRETVHPEIADQIDAADEHHPGWYHLCPCSRCQITKQAVRS